MPDRPSSRRPLAVVAVAVVALAGLAVLSQGRGGSSASGMGRYNPDAIAALDGGQPPGGTRLVTALEAQNVCQQAASYADGARRAHDALASIDGSTRTAYATGRLQDGQVDVAALARRAKDQITAAESSGSAEPVRAFVTDACAGVDLSTPVLAGS